MIFMATKMHKKHKRIALRLSRRKLQRAKENLEMNVQIVGRVPPRGENPTPPEVRRPTTGLNEEFVVAALRGVVV